LGYFWGVEKTGFLLVFNLQFLDLTYLQTWDAPARVKFGNTPTNQRQVVVV